MWWNKTITARILHSKFNFSRFNLCLEQKEKVFFQEIGHIVSCVSKPHNCKIFNFEVFAFLYSKQHNSSISDIKMSKFSPETRFFTLFLYLCCFEHEQNLRLIQKCTSFLLVMLFWQWNQNNITEKNSNIFPLKWPKSPQSV